MLFRNKLWILIYVIIIMLSISAIHASELDAGLDDSNSAIYESELDAGLDDSNSAVYSSKLGAGLDDSNSAIYESELDACLDNSHSAIYSSKLGASLDNSIINDSDVDIDENQYSSQNISNNELGVGEAPFTQLKALILPATTNIVLPTDYLYNPQVDNHELGVSGIKIANPITIDGQNHIIDGAFQSYIFRISCPQGVVLKNIIFQNARSQGGDCADNMKDGSALYLMSSKVTIINCTFRNNQATRNGGAIFANPTSQLNISNSIFENNRALDGDGGAVYTKNLTVDNATFTSNTASRNGGAVHANSFINSTNSKFFNNSAQKNGGGVNKPLYYEGIFINNIFERNHAESGGGIYSDNSIFLGNCSFSNNTANKEGGAVYSETLDVESNPKDPENNYNIFSFNKADKGGAIWTREFRQANPEGGHSDGVLRYYVFLNNTATNFGGALYINSPISQVTIKQCKFSDNNFEVENRNHHGTAICIMGESTLDLQYNIITGHNYLNGAGSVVYFDIDTQYTIKNNWWGINDPPFTTQDIIIQRISRCSDTQAVYMGFGGRRDVTGGAYDIEVSIKSGHIDLISEKLFMLDVNVTPIAGVTVSNPVITTNTIKIHVVPSQTVSDVSITIDDQKFSKHIIYDPNLKTLKIVNGILFGTLILGGSAITTFFIYLDGNETGDGGNGSIDNPFTTLQDAIDNAEEGSVIYIEPGTYAGEGNINLKINKELTFYCSGEAIIDAEGKSRIFNVNSQKINIQGLTFVNGTAETGGAILFNDPLSDSFINATFINNSHWLGAAMYFAKSATNVRISDSKFINNSLNSVYFSENSKNTLIENSLFMNSHINQWIGDIYAMGGVSLKSSWLGGDKDYLPISNVDVLSYLFLDADFTPKNFSPGTPLTMELNLYEYDLASGNIFKYDNRFGDLEFSLSSDNGELYNSTVKLGEKFIYIPYFETARINTTINGLNIMLYLSNSMMGNNQKVDSHIKKNETAKSSINESSSNDYGNDYQSANGHWDSFDNGLLSHNDILTSGDNSSTIQSNAIKSISFAPFNNYTLTSLLILLVGMAVVLIWKNKDKS